jgi:hypothetical protein
VTVWLSVLLLVNAAFNILVWPTFLKRIARDPRARDEYGKATRFLTVHVVLIVTALVLAAISAIAGIVGLLSL